MAASPDGRLLALALAKRNRVLVFDVDNLRVLPAPRAGDRPPFVELALFPDVRAPVLVDLSFSPEGDTLWVLSGGTDRNKSLGPQPTTVTALRLPRTDATGTSIGLARARTVVLPDVDRPVALGTGRSLALTSGSAVRLPPEKATVFVSRARTRQPAPGDLRPGRRGPRGAGGGRGRRPARWGAPTSPPTAAGCWARSSTTARPCWWPRPPPTAARARPGSFRVADRASPDTLAGAELRLQP